MDRLQHTSAVSGGQHCSADAMLQGAIRDAWIDDSAQGSDHQPYWVELGEF